MTSVLGYNVLYTPLLANQVLLKRSLVRSCVSPETSLDDIRHEDPLEGELSSSNNHPEGNHCYTPLCKVMRLTQKREREKRKKRDKIKRTRTDECVAILG